MFVNFRGGTNGRQCFRTCFFCEKHTGLNQINIYNTIIYKMVDNNYKILIVDDEPENIEILFTILSTLNFDFFVATDGKTCLDILQNEIPSAIIMDWEMPGLSGIETIKQIRTNEKTKNIPIIMATGKMTSSENLETALSAGANDFIRKPYDKIEIIARIKSMIHLFEENQKIIELEKQILQIEIDNTNNELEGNRKKLTTSTLKLTLSAFSELSVTVMVIRFVVPEINEPGTGDCNTTD